MASTQERTLDPVCGMRVDPEKARARGLVSRYEDVDYHFCNPGCKAAFDRDAQFFKRRQEMN